MATIEIPATQSIIDQAQPGDVLKLAAGTRERVGLVGLRGTADRPIRLVGQGTHVQTTGWCALDVSDCQHVILENIELSGGGPECTNGLFIRKCSEYIEASNLDIHDSRQTGVKCHTLISDAPAGWVQHDVYIHNCAIHDCATEAMYVGHASTQNRPTCHADGMRVEYCEIERCGWGGIQIRNASNVLVRGNVIRDCGLGVDASHAGGGQNVGPEVNGVWCENEIENCERGVHLLDWDGLVELHHNVLVRNGLHGPKGEQPSIRGMGSGALSVHHNTVVLGGAGEAIRLPYGQGEVRDNLLVDPSVIDAAGFDCHHNTFAENVSAVKFRDPSGGDWSLQADSPAAGAASDGGATGACGMEVAPGPEPPPEPGPELPPESKTMRVLMHVLDEDGNVTATFAGELERLGQ